MLCGGRSSTHTQTSHVSLCNACHADLPWYRSARCPQCALPALDNAHCGICLQHPPAFDHTLAGLRYAFPLNRLLHQFKYQQDLAAGALLSGLLLQAADPPAALPDSMIAMPMHTHRLQQRGFNHALEIAKVIQTQWKIPLLPDGCIRLTDTPTQAGLDLKTRIRNLRSAFATEKNWQGKHVLIVDDVMTTGASMHALATVIKRAGARQVTALVLARTLKDAID